MMKFFCLLLLIFVVQIGKTQSIKSIQVNLYTDSLKKGTYNYINIEGLMSNGNYLPMDSTHLKYLSTGGQFFGNNLWIEPNFSALKVNITVTAISDSTLYKNFDIWIKQLPDAPLKTKEELMEELKQGSQKKKSKN